MSVPENPVAHLVVAPRVVLILLENRHDAPQRVVAAAGVENPGGAIFAAEVADFAVHDDGPGVLRVRACAVAHEAFHVAAELRVLRLVAGLGFEELHDHFFLLRVRAPAHAGDVAVQVVFNPLARRERAVDLPERRFVEVENAAQELARLRAVALRPADRDCVLVRRAVVGRVVGGVVQIAVDLLAGFDRADDIAEDLVVLLPFLFRAV